MVIGCCSIKFYLHGNNSLKGKRRVVRAIKDRLKNDFNVSVAEVGNQDVWQSLTYRHIRSELRQALHGWSDG